MRSHIVRITLLSLLSAVCCGGCGGDEEETKEVVNPFAGMTIDVSLPAGLGLEREWELAVSEWEQRTGAKVQLTPREISPGTSLVEAYGGSAEAAGDLILFPLTGLSELGDADWLPIISDAQRQSSQLDFSDIFQGLRESAISRYGGPAALPLSCPTLVCYYREDLLSAAKLPPPRTWDEYQKLVETTDEWAGGLPVIEPWSEEFRATMFLARAASYVKHPDEYSMFFDIRTGEPQLESPGFQRALQLSRAAVKSMPPEVLNYDTYDCRREFFAGRAAMAITFETGEGNPLPAMVPQRRRESVPDPAEPRPAELAIGFVRLPGAGEVYHHSKKTWTTGRDEGINYVTYTGFGGLAATVPTGNAEQAPAAWNLLQFLTAREQFGMAFPPYTRSVCRASQTSDPDLWLPVDMTASEGGRYLGELALTLDNKTLVTELPLLGRTKFRAALTTGLTAALTGEAEPEAALKDITAKWQAIAEELGVKSVRDSYRRSLGLRPLGAEK